MTDFDLQSVVWEEDRSNLDVVIGLAQHPTDPGTLSEEPRTSSASTSFTQLPFA
jgi:hypothetical protein